MTYADLVDLYFNRATSLQWYWTIYVVVIGGLLAFSSLRKEPDVISCVLITVLYAFFAYKNLGAIEDVVQQRTAAYTLITAHEADAPSIQRSREHLEKTLVVQTVDDVRYFHIASDVVTIAAFWAMEWRRRRAAAMRVVPS
jgi:hypothetical protein